jgi:hypothetical protein
MIIEIRNPELEAKLIAQAQARGVSVESLIASIIEGLNGVQSGATEIEDPRIATMREAMNDEMFLADLSEIMEDFKYVDTEYNQ